MNRSLSIALLASVMASLMVSSVSFASQRVPKGPPPKFKNQAQRDKYFKITSVEIRDVTALQPISVDGLVDPQPAAPQIPTPQVPAQPAPMPQPSVGSSIPSPATILSWITLGEKIFDLIKANEPVANVSTKTVSVLPIAQQNWSQMEYWQGPARRSFEMDFKNGYGMVVARHAYTISFNYGGKLNGAGHYIANATVVPTDVEVGWGFTLNSSVEISDAVNVNSSADPIPSLTIQVHWAVSSFASRSQSTAMFDIRGDGQITQQDEE
jgi:hypothetical protein